MPTVDLTLHPQNLPEPLLLLPFFLVSNGGNAVTAMASIAGRLLHCSEWTPCMDGARGAEESDYQRNVRVQSCIRPLNAAVRPPALM
jgi:hypothetical protein